MSAALLLCGALISACGGGSDDELAADQVAAEAGDTPVVSAPPFDADSAPPAMAPVSDTTKRPPPEASAAPPVEAAPPSEQAPAAPSQPVPAPVEPDADAGERETDALQAAASNGRYALPTMPSPPASAIDVTKVCNGECPRPNDSKDDTAAIQYALDKAKSGQWLVFPPGHYLIGTSLKVRVPGLTLWGKGATLHATNPDNQSIVIETDGTRIYNFKLTAVTAKRGKTHQHTRIAVYPNKDQQPVVRDTVIRRNQIVPAGDPGTPLAHGGSASGIFLSSADGFLVAENTVVRTLADAIHITGGSKNGKVIANKVRENGDDMIAMVSYAYSRATSSAREMLQSYDARASSNQVRNIVVAHNDLAGQYWGRGLTVVGGRDITIYDNRIANTAHGAAILVVRESSYGTFGVENVVVEKNRIEDVQNKNPPYDFERKFANGGRTGHGAIEVHSSLRDDEAALSTLSNNFAVKSVVIRDNRITRSATPGVRVGVGDGRLAGIYIENNTLSEIKASDAIRVYDAAKGEVNCNGNNNAGAALSAKNCGSARAPSSIDGAGS